MFVSDLVLLCSLIPRCILIILAEVALAFILDRPSVSVGGARLESQIKSAANSTPLAVGCYIVEPECEFAQTIKV